MTKFEEIMKSNIKELAELIDKYGQFDNSPWIIWWNETYCSNCESIVCKVKNEDAAYHVGQTINCSYCELHDKCRYFPDMNEVPSNKEIIEMWLKQEN